MKFFNVKSPFFLPVGRRLVVTVLCALWALFELMNGATFWALIFGAIAAYLAYAFFIAFDPADFTDEKDPDA